MTFTVRRSDDRGVADHGWLRSRHTFSFADYHDPTQMGFRTLRVINEDRVAPARGFAAHAHRDMEIFSYVLRGSLRHEDSLGNARTLHPGDVQMMSAGTGIVHSEMNPSPTEPVHFLQLWITPRTMGLPPTYSEWHPSDDQSALPKVLLISEDGREGSARLHQDADVFRLRLATGDAVSHTLRPGRGLWIQTAKGTLTIDGVALSAGDGGCTSDAGVRSIVAREPCEALLFDLG